MYPTIKNIVIRRPYKYLWLKYVIGVNLNYHCARCLLGAYSEKINPDIEVITPIVLDEAPARYYYLCGVAKSGKWADNFHLAFKHVPGEMILREGGGIDVIIQDATEIQIVPIDKTTNTHPKRFLPFYHTCRNWRFANMIIGDFNDAKDN